MVTQYRNEQKVQIRLVKRAFDNYIFEGQKHRICTAFGTKLSL